MALNILGFPRIGKNRELKKALESYWAKESLESELLACASALKKEHWELQKSLDYVCVNDFSLYDNMLDLAFALGAIPKAYEGLQGLDCYFAMARGNKNLKALEMTKWFNTNYHYVVPELDINYKYILNTNFIKESYKEAIAFGFRPKISLIGFFTFFALSKITNGEIKAVFKKVKETYLNLIKNLVQELKGELVIEFSEPVFVKGWTPLEKLGISQDSVIEFYNAVNALGIKIIVSTFFEHSKELTETLVQTNIYGIGLDFVYGEKNLQSLEILAKSDKVLFAGIIDGRNVWVANLESKLALLQNIAKKIPHERIVLSSSCSLLHLPFSTESETKMDKETLSWLCFAKEKITELELLDSVFRNGISPNNKTKWEQNITINKTRKNATKIHNANVQERLKEQTITTRALPFNDRIKIQRETLNYPTLATTTIGSFPQTPELRALRRNYKSGAISKEIYESGIQDYIRDCVRFQEEIGLDVLVHGEPERNDMVEYFGERLRGFVFSQNAWVQSYGSRCVKPPIIYGDIARLEDITLQWTLYAQSLTKKRIKGMLTGPVTILNWSFVRDDLERSVICKQLALALRDEIDALQNNGILIIQVDEAAFKEGYPLRIENVLEYERWALESFKLATAIAKPQTQIHTHMCYSEFNDIIKTIEDMDADVISIETARSGNKLLKVFKSQGYQNEIGPGVYDIHSPRIPSVEEIKKQILSLLEVLPKEQLWINPDCGLKTRKWEEVKPSLKNMIEATKAVRKTL
ncbi:5-methyltetrahydropteroyltriglutamate--homocysteine S-methyltransferase [Helicobacter turcicus]|uniref:5-methyltetrahydropteroyltriglutamate--homocysteine S-methyltransferase n=1 Tax=Helicobacter turcicus TaxID=2867412 RepID=A0ABS7JM37_9HELI|nr:5-methyltetrahydropteroyltriglutamate--homocysteine S-methyltransferase [Helicobacter turcicus]MBX7490452.1 5-methyltetrahydropteroyltriglutamate--homocysteine S-methyltransferase [Helicobacter turcicus]MBX7545312.1 5-methyltetrahydropteroyltriglutamate--homocysteine S-methyltransferase [Helicobacter turcicus]